jgi:phage terminase large subunit
LDEDYVKSLEELIDVDANLHKIYTLGEWGSLENQVYTNWEQELFGYQYEDFDATIAGVDFGWENPNAFILLGLKERNIYVIDELYMRGSLNSEFIEKIQEKLKEHIPDIRLHRQIPMYCDAAEPSKIAEMKAANLNVHPAKKDVLDGISAVRQHKIIINPRAVQTLKEIHGYSRQKDKDGNIQELPDKRKGFDHLMDAMRYAIYTWTLKQRKGGRVIMPQIVGEGGGRWGGLR